MRCFKERVRLPYAVALNMVEDKEFFIKKFREEGLKNLVDIQYEPSVVHSVVFRGRRIG